MAVKKLPLTSARLSSSLVIKAYALNEFDKVTGMWQSPRTKVHVLTQVTKFKRRQERDVYLRYEVGENSFEPRDLIPGKIKTTLSMSHVVLYKADLLATLGFSFSGNLIEQTLPLLIQEIQMYPEELKDTNINIIEYQDCWLTSNPMEYDTSGDQIVIQDVTIACGKVVVVPAAGSAIDALEGALGTLSALGAAATATQKTITQVEQTIQNPLQFF